MQNVKKFFIHGGKEVKLRDDLWTWHSGSANVTKIDFQKNLERQCDKIIGSFAIVVEEEEKISLVCDCIRSIPLFYTSHEKEIVIGDDAAEIARKCGASLQESSVQEFLSTGYVTECNTLFIDIWGVEPGEIVTISKVTGEVQKRHYFELHYENSEEKSVEEYLQEMDECYCQVFHDLIERLNGKTAVLPLSGGCDSRTVAVMLKRLGYENVVCFSYGRVGNSESARSQQVAQALAFPWRFIEYNESVWRDFYRSQVYTQYLTYAARGVSEACVQPLPAIMQISKEHKGVCIPGHALDFSAGSHIPDMQKDVYTRMQWIKHILKKHYSLNKHDVDSYIIQKWMKNVPDSLNRDIWICEYQRWEWKNRQAKFIANDVRAYEFAGYEWELPFWDKRVCEFWQNVPYKLLQGRRLQYLYMKKYIDPVANLQQNYAAINPAYDVKQKIKRAVYFLKPIVQCYRSLRNYKSNEMAFYDWMSKKEYIDALRKYGVTFSVNSIIANDIISQYKNSIF